ncbi:MAG: hypothetical protein BGO67_09380 [Alphaproteobacteria bacterium 41-28]|nr:MAG: hypothetical protein BGO67_09380 [Alphaproteobacteria bacterium 41-28]
MKPLHHFLKTLPLLSVLFMIMGCCGLSLGDYPLLPALFLTPVYYWLVFHPSWLPVWGLFGVGLFYDALFGYELGFSCLLLMGSSFLGQYVRPLLNPDRFLLIWCGFGIYSLGYLILYGVLSSGGLPILVSWIYGVILYPLVAWVLSHLHLRLQSYA